MSILRLRSTFRHPRTMSAFVFGLPSTPSLTTRTTFLSPLSPSHSHTNVASRPLSMVLDRPRRNNRGMRVWGPTSFDLMFPDRMMRNFLEPFGEMMQYMGEDNLIEEENQYKVKMIMPGVRKEDIRVDVKGDVLNLRVEKDMEEKSEEKEGGQVEWVRRQMQRVNRSWRMPDNADLASIKAVTKDGILTVTVPKTDKSEPTRTIDVEGE